jgi:hypothetical protein
MSMMPGAPELPCGRLCPIDAPICDEGTQRCVQCTQDDARACGGDTPLCFENTCVQCTELDKTKCPDQAKVCNGSNQCVVCMSDRPGSCPAAQPFCDNETRCVECMDNQSCNMPERSRCDVVSNTCSACLTSVDCAHVAGRPYCDPGLRSCVACSLDPLEAPCKSGFICDSASRVCVPGPTLANCSPCMTDLECAANESIAACIPLGEPAAKYCFAGAMAGQRCPDGYESTIPAGRNMPYCVPRSGSCGAASIPTAPRACRRKEMCLQNEVCDGDQCVKACMKDQDCPSNKCNLGTRFCMP